MIDYVEAFLETGDPRYLRTRKQGKTANTEEKTQL